MGNIKIPLALCVKCDDGVMKPCIGKREKALCAMVHYFPAHKRSKKKKADDVIYQELKDEYLAEYPYCQIRIAGICVSKAVDIHHPIGYGAGAYLDVSTFLGACRFCHRYAEDHPTEAYEKGYSGKRLTIK